MRAKSDNGFEATIKFLMNCFQRAATGVAATEGPQRPGIVLHQQSKAVAT